MNARKYCWLLSGLMYGYFFYDHTVGINLFLFNLLLLGGTLWLKPSLWKDGISRFFLLASILSSLSVVWHYGTWAIVMNLVSLMCWAGVSLQNGSSMMVSSINGIISIFGGGLIGILNRKDAEPQAANAKRSSFTVYHLLTWVVPVIIVVIFFLLYTSASPAFAHLVQGIDLSFISPGWCLFTLLGLFLLLGFFYPIANQYLTNADAQQPDQLERKRRPMIFEFGTIGLKYEYRTGLILLIMLNALLLVVNLSDLTYIVQNKKPSGVTYSDYLHHGVNTLIFSIVLAIIIVMYFFRGNLNFFKKNQKLKYAAYGWILQNLMLVMIISGKNNLYVAEHGLTFKRIGVYVYLLLTIFGLITTYLKVREVKSNWYLFRKNTWLAYSVLLMLSFIDWSSIITSYNLRNMPTTRLDIPYLTSLSESNIPILHQAMQENDKLTNDQKTRIDWELTDHAEKIRQQSWLSWTYAGWQVKQLTTTE